MGNKGMMRLVRDPDSHTGLSAAILIRNIRPKRIKTGEYKVAHSEFSAGMMLNCDGFMVRPNVVVTIMCKLLAGQVESIKRQKRWERAMACSPMLK